MNRHLVLFIITFTIGTVIAIVVRTSTHHPYATQTNTPASSSEKIVSPVTAPAVSAHDTAAPHTMSTAAAATIPPPQADAHITHAASGSATVNTICPICGEPVDPALPAADYAGKKVGFGCAACPPKFKDNPAKYGEAALKNQVVE